MSKSQVPLSWRLVPLRDLLSESLANGRSVPTADEGFPVLRLTSLRDGRIDLNEKKVGAWTATEAQNFRAAEGDVLVSRGNGSLNLVGRAGIVGQVREPVAFPDTLIRVRVRKEDCDTAFLVAQWNGPEFRSQIEAAAKTTAGIYKVSQGDLEALNVAIPHVNEQRRIVAKLEALQARSRRARAALDAVPPLLEKLRQSILAAAFRGDLTKDWRAKNKNVEPAEKLLARIRVERRKKWEEAELAKMTAKGKVPKDDGWKAKYKEPEPVDTAGLPELPVGWCWASVEELSSFITSGSRGWAEYYADAGPLFIRSQDINSDALCLQEVAHVQVPESAEGARTRVQRHDLLITITGANVTRCAWVTEEPGEAYVSQHVALVRPVPSVAAPFLHLSMTDESGGRRQLKNAAYGLGKPGLNLTDVATVRVPLPPLAEQAELVRRATLLAAVATSTSVTIDGLRSTLDGLSRSTLAKAFRGELVPQDPNDEPAQTTLAQPKPEGRPKAKARR